MFGFTKSPGDSIRSRRSKTRRAFFSIITAQPFGAIPIQLLINGGVMSLLILRLGGNNLEVGAVFTCNFLGQMARLFVAPHVDVADRKKMFFGWMIVGNLLLGAMLLVLPVQRTFGPRAAIWTLIILFFAQRLTMNVAAAAFQPLICDVIPSRLRGRFFGTMRGTFQACSFVAILLAGWYLGDAPRNSQFFILIAILFVIGMIRPILMSNLPSPPPSRKGAREPLLKNLSRPLRDAAFRKYIIFWATLAIAANLARPFIVPFLKTQLDFPSGHTVYCANGVILGMVFGFGRWGRVADKFGSRLVMCVSIILLAFAIGMVCAIPSYHSGAIMAMAVAASSFCLVGFALSGLSIGQTVRIMYEAPEKSRGAYMGLFFTTNGVVAGLASVCGGIILDHLPETFAIGSLVIPTMRAYFPCMALVLLSSTLMLIKLKPIAEKPLGEAMVDFVDSLPPPFGTPIRMLNRWIASDS